MNTAPVSVNTTEDERPLHARLDACVPAARARQRAFDAWPRLDRRLHLAIGGCCEPRHAWWVRGGDAIRACLDDIGAPAEAYERYEHLFDLPADPCAAAKAMMDLEQAPWAPEGAPPRRDDRAPEPPAPKSAQAPRKSARAARAEAEIDLFAEVAG